MIVALAVMGPATKVVTAFTVSDGPPGALPVKALPCGAVLPATVSAELAVMVALMVMLAVLAKPVAA